MMNYLTVAYIQRRTLANLSVPDPASQMRRKWVEERIHHDAEIRWSATRTRAEPPHRTAFEGTVDRVVPARYRTVSITEAGHCDRRGLVSVTTA
jgi:hypothetical protein